MDLADSRILILDRIFHRDDLDRRLFDFIECAVERRRFSAPCGTGDQDDAVRQGDQFVKRLGHLIGHTDVLQIEDHASFIQESHDHPFSVDHRNNGNTNVDFAAGNTQLDSAVLWDSLFCDIQLGHDLESRHNRGEEVRNRFGDRLHS